MFMNKPPSSRYSSNYINDVNNQKQRVSAETVAITVHLTRLLTVYAMTRAITVFKYCILGLTIYARTLAIIVL